MHVKKGDKVIVIAGKDKGQTGTVSKALPKEDRVVIDGVNKKKVHKKPQRRGDEGQIVEISMPMHVSNVALAKETKKVPAKKK